MTERTPEQLEELRSRREALEAWHRQQDSLIQAFLHQFFPRWFEHHSDHDGAVSAVSALMLAEDLLVRVEEWARTAETQADQNLIVQRIVAAFSGPSHRDNGLWDASAVLESYLKERDAAQKTDT